jgi:hypothetical protein
MTRPSMKTQSVVQLQHHHQYINKNHQGITVVAKEMMLLYES